MTMRQKVLVEHNWQSISEIASYLGKNVRITLDWDDPHAFITGYFFGIDVEGNGIVETGKERRYVWPVLFVEEI